MYNSFLTLHTHFNFLAVVVLSLSRYHNILLGLINNSVNAVYKKLSFFRQSDMIAYAWLDKKATFN